MYLRAYSQKNPLLEYKLEGFQIFDDMLKDIRADIARKIFKVRIQPSHPGAPAPRRVAAGRRPPPGDGAVRRGRRRARRGSPGRRAAARPAAPRRMRAASRPRAGEAREPKVGRNDPCPCGSGKKYKYCHGAGA